MFKGVSAADGGEVVENAFGERGCHADPLFFPVVVFHVPQISGDVPAERDAEEPRFREIRLEIVAFETVHREDSRALAAAGEVVVRIENIHIGMGQFDHARETVRIRPACADLGVQEVLFFDADVNVLPVRFG